MRLASALRTHADGVASVEVDLADPAMVGDVLNALAAVHPAIGRRVRDEQGALRRHVSVFVGPDNVKDLDGLATTVPSGAELSLLPAVSGG